MPHKSDPQNTPVTRESTESPIVNNETLHPHETPSRQLRRYKTGFFLSTFGIGPAFGAFVTYVTFQIQMVGYTIGHIPGGLPGSGCPPTATSCRVPFAGSGSVNLTSYMLYLNAISYAVSGALTLIVSGIGDRLSFQREQYIVMMILYGALCLPAAGLTGYDHATFRVFSGLYVAFDIIGFLSQAWMNIFVPFVMHQSPASTIESGTDDNTSDSPGSKGEKNGISMSVWGCYGLNAGQVFIYVVVIGLSYTSAKFAGLYITTAAGAVCVILSFVAWPLLPSPKRQSKGTLEPLEWLTLPVKTCTALFQGLWQYPEAFKYLLAYTIYNDSVFAFGSVTGQLFNLNVRPSLREYTIYSLVGAVVSVVSATLFLFLYSTSLTRFGITLRHWSAFCYGIVTFCAIWCCIGISDSTRIGLKHRWEFYFLQVLQSIAGSIASVCFRVLFAKLFPRGNEVQYFGFQLVLSCSTVWIPQIVNGPIVNATNNMRLPGVISVVFFLISLGLVVWTDEIKGSALAK